MCVWNIRPSLPSCLFANGCLQDNPHLCLHLLRPLFKNVAEHQVPFVNAEGERRVTRIFHDIELHDLNHGTASANLAGPTPNELLQHTWFAGVDDCGVEAAVHFRFNHRAILSLLEGGFIRHEHVMDDQPGLVPWTM